VVTDRRAWLSIAMQKLSCWHDAWKENGGAHAGEGRLSAPEWSRYVRIMSLPQRGTLSSLVVASCLLGAAGIASCNQSSGHTTGTGGSSSTSTGSGGN
jgi:hypothetical protein